MFFEKKERFFDNLMVLLTIKNVQNELLYKTGRAERTLESEGNERTKRAEITLRTGKAERTLETERIERNCKN